MCQGFCVYSYTPKDSTSAFDCELHDSWIISITSTRHICNDLSLFKRFDPVYDGSVLKLGSKSVPILASGVVEIHPTADNGQRFTVTLNNTAYVPDMHTNIFSIQKTEQRGVYYKCRLNRLEERDGQPFCQLFSHYSQRVVEYNPRKNTRTNSAAVDRLTAAIEMLDMPL